MNIKSMVFFMGLCFLLACSSKDNAGASTSVEDSNIKTENKTDDEPQVEKRNSGDKEIDASTNYSDNSNLEASIQDIRKEFQNTEKNLKSFTKKTAKMEEGGGSNADLVGYYDKDGILRKVIWEEVMGHGASTISYYLKNGRLYFIFEQSTSEASVMGPFTFKEKRIYFKGGEIIRLLEKEKTVKGDEDPNLSKVPNKEVTASLKEKSGKVYFDEIDKILKLLADTSKSTEQAKVGELSFENTRWKSKDDPKSVIEVKNSKWKNIYDGKNVGTGDYKLEKKSNGSQLTINENGEVYKYHIIKHTATELQMSMIGGRGNTLTYEKD